MIQKSNAPGLRSGRAKARDSIEAPRLLEIAGRRQLVLGKDPFLILGGELHNSSGGSAATIAAGLDRLKYMGANTALVPVSWELTEPAEGQFDFTHVDELIEGARDRKLKLIPLWFGTWKNGQSSYVPDWVKLDVQRFPRALIRDVGPIEHLTPFGDEVASADAAAFAALMEHLAARDSDVGTVVMVQVENEVGLLGDSRDRSDLANARFATDVPQQLLNLLATGVDIPLRRQWEARGRLSHGQWADVFGDGPETDEAFMACAYAQHVERVAQSGRRQHRVPLFINTWLNSEGVSAGAELTGGDRPGVYPSGGPVLSVAPIWRALAPTLALVSPDIYVGDFNSICERYTAANAGALFIPEMRRDETGAGQLFVAVGSHAPLGVSPFGVDSGVETDLDAIRDAFRLLAATAATISQTPPGEMCGFFLPDASDQPVITVASRRFAARCSRPSDDPGVTSGGYGLVIRTGEEEYVAVGRGFVLEPISGSSERIGILGVDELHVDGDGLRTGRRLNGDETMAGAAWLHPARGNAAPGALPIAAEGENSGITRCRLYSF